MAGVNLMSPGGDNNVMESVFAAINRFRFSFQEASYHLRGKILMFLHQFSIFIFSFFFLFILLSSSAESSVESESESSIHTYSVDDDRIANTQ